MAIAKILQHPVNGLSHLLAQVYDRQLLLIQDLVQKTLPVAQVFLQHIIIQIVLSLQRDCFGLKLLFSIGCSEDKPRNVVQGLIATAVHDELVSWNSDIYMIGPVN